MELITSTAPAKPKKKPAKKTPAKKTKLKKDAKSKVKKTIRYERIDMRLSAAEKARIVAKAKKLRRTVTSLVLEALEKIK